MAQATFNEWRRTLSRVVNSEIGLSMGKLPVFPLEDWWKGGLTPKDALEVIRDEIGSTDDLFLGWEEQV